MICVILQLIVDLIWTTHRKFFWKHFTFRHKINKSNANVSTHYWIICLYSTNICYNIFAASEIFNFIWNIFNSKALKACYIITIHMQSHLMICTHEGLLHNFFFFLSGLYSQTLTIHMTAGDRRDHLLFHSAVSTHSRKLRHLFATLHVTWLSRIFNRNTCVYQTATQFDLLPYHITIWVIDGWCNVCLFTWWIDTRILLQRFDIGNRWIWTRIDCHPYITMEPINQVC